MELKSTMDCKSADLNSIFSRLGTSEKGLSESSAAERVKEFGFNEVPEKKTNIVIEFLKYFWGPIPWFLEAAVVMTFLIGDVKDAVIIAGLVILNTVIAFYNEHDSQKALALLKKKLTIKTSVLRDGKWSARDARDLVPGDIITISLGDIVPADAKIISGTTSADQASLTGESLPVELHESDIIFTGSIIKRGEVKCVVVNTGMRTYFGKTVQLVNIAKAKSHQEEVMFKISKNLIYAGMFAFFLIFCYSLFIDVPLLTILTFAVLFIVGGIPAALPVMFTISQAKGATDLSKQGILVTKLESIENAASVEVLCLDKTGTITMNALEVSEAIAFTGFSKGELIAMSALASSAESKDSIDNTVISYANQNNIDISKYKRIEFIPFEPSTKREEAKFSYNGRNFRAIKGASQVVISLCRGMTPAQMQEATSKVEELSAKGCRVLGVAKSDPNNYENLNFAGLLALSDPLRTDSNNTIAYLKQVGISPIMLTGDNIAVAREIAKQVGLGDKIVCISEIKALPELEQAAAILNCNGIAEIFPEDKFWVVKILQANTKTVGMTGDGVNDSPALKQAELGLAVSNSADVAKAAASMVITEPGTSQILEAIKISRQAYQRMLTWTLKKICRSIQFMAILSVGFFWLQDIIVSISGLMLLVVVNDFMTMSLAVDNSRSSKNPNAWNVKNITLASIFLGILFFIIELALLVFAQSYLHLGLDQIKTLMLISLVYTGQFGIIIVRERGFFWKSMPARFVSITIAFAMVLFTLLAIFGVVLTPLPAWLVLFTLAVCVIFVLLMDPLKIYAFKRLGIS